MNWTADCSPEPSREHFLSAAVLRLLGPEYVAVNGVPWLGPDETKPLPISGLASHILCKRHNEGMSVLDEMAGKFFGTVQSIYDDLGNYKSLSRKRRWYLFSGEELEFWLIKTAFGLYHSGTVAQGREKLCETQGINVSIMQAFQGASIPAPCGMYVVMDDRNWSGRRNLIDCASLSSDGNERMIGLKLRYMGLVLAILFDLHSTYNEEFVVKQTYRPHFVHFKNRLRSHTIMLTWRHNDMQRGVLVPVGRARELTV